MTKEYVYEVKNTDTDKVIATLWWDGAKVQCSDPGFLRRLNRLAPNNKDASDGIDFLEQLPMHFKNGYMLAYRVG